MKYFFILACIFFFYACSYTSTNIGASKVQRKQMMLVGSEEINAQSAKAYAQILNEAQNKGILNQDSILTRRVQGIAKRLIDETSFFRPDVKDWDWQVNVITSDELNAWCMSGGKMVVYSSLITKLHLDDDEIAVILGHEISHALREHIRERQSQNALKQGILNTASFFGINSFILSASDTLATLGIDLPYSRVQENESDALGLELAFRAGFNPDAAVRVWEKMQETRNNTGIEFLSTHPSPKNRIKNLQKLSLELKNQASKK